MERKINIVSENIRALDSRADLTEKQTDVCVEQLCRIINDTVENIYDAWECFNRLSGKDLIERKAALCRKLCNNAKFSDELEEMIFFGDKEETEATAWRKIAYVRNKRNDKIFLDFSDAIGGAKAHYATSFSDACEAVFNGTCQYCIIPIENSSEGKIYSFYSMIDRYEMRINRVIREYSEETSQSVSFALASKKLSLLTKNQERLRFEFSVTNESADIVSSIIEAVNCFGGNAVDVGTLPVPYDEPRRKFYFTVDISEADALACATYMSLEYAGYSPIGFYKI